MIAIRIPIWPCTRENWLFDLVQRANHSAEFSCPNSIEESAYFDDTPRARLHMREQVLCANSKPLVHLPVSHQHVGNRDGPKWESHARNISTNPHEMRFRAACFTLHRQLPPFSRSPAHPGPCWDAAKDLLKRVDWERSLTQLKLEGAVTMVIAGQPSLIFNFAVSWNLSWEVCITPLATTVERTG